MATATKTSPKQRKLPTPKGKAKSILALAVAADIKSAEIARVLNTSPENVCQVLNRYGIERNNLESFKKNRADILAGTVEKLLNTVNLADAKAESCKDIRDLAVAVGALSDKERLERGQATEIVDYRGMVLSLGADAEMLRERLSHTE
jgi:DNA-directed RNA polymerase specialized sigma subunit